MASKEATIYILDVGPTLKAKREGSSIPRHEELKDVLLKLLANKVHMGRKTVYVSVILVGSNVTNNDLASVDEDGADYQFVEVVQPLSMASLHLMKNVNENVELGDTMGDCMDGLIVGLDMMTKFCKKLKYDKKIYIMTDASAEINTEGVEQIMATLQEDNVQLNVIGTDFDGDDDAEPRPKSPIQSQNEVFFKNLCESTSGNTFSIDEALDITSQFYSKKVKPVPVYRGTLTLGDPETEPDVALDIPVQMFPGTMQASLPTAKKYSVLSENTAADDLPEGQTGIVNLSRTYKLKVTAETVGGENGEMEVDTEVPAESLEKAYMYGKTIVPIRNVDLEAYKLRTAKSLSILGFFSASTFKREWLMANIYTVFPAPGDGLAEVQMSGLLFALFEKNSYALCRYVRVDDAEPKLGVLWPEISVEHKCFYFGQVAFSEDVRRYLFSSLDDIQTATGKKLEKHRLLATPDMVSACKDFIDSMDLMTAEGGEEYLRPDTTFNPSIQRQMQLVQFRALNPTAEFPPVPESLIAQLCPLPNMLLDAQTYSDQLIRLWDIHQQEKSIKTKRGYGASLGDEAGDKENLAGVQDGSIPGSNSLLDGLLGSVPGNKRHKSESVFGTATASSLAGIAAVAAGGTSISMFGGQSGGRDLAASGMIPFEMMSIREVGTSDPVRDFEAMVKIATINSQQGVRPAGAGWLTVSMAVEQMKRMIVRLITTSFGDQLYEKALDCLKSLRRALSDTQALDVLPLEDDSESATQEKHETIKSRVEMWNAFVKECKTTCLNTAVSPLRTDFWDMVVKQKDELGLLRKGEVPAYAGGVSEEEAEQFMVDSMGDTTIAQEEEPDAPDEDDLLALMD